MSIQNNSLCFTLVLLVVKGLNDHFNFNWLFIHLLPPGAPVKIENLPFKRKAVNDILDDPRPEKYRKMEGYTDFVRNAMVNYCANTSEDLLYDTFFLVLIYKYV
jgi:hypothetical protein